LDLIERPLTEESKIEEDTLIVKVKPLEIKTFKLKVT
jgi:hypothetical protein